MRRLPRGFILLALVISFSLASGSCGGGGPGAPAGAPTGSVTDTSGDFAITVRVDSPSQLSVSWENPTAQYLQTPESFHSTVYRSGAEIVPSTAGFRYADAGLLPETTYCYRVEVTAVYQYLFPGSYITVGWSSGTACLATPYGLRVLSTSPEAGDVTMPAAQAISATFNGAIDPLSVASSSFVVSGPAGILAGRLAVNGRTVTFTPDNVLLYNTPYTATVTTSVADVDGFSLTADYRWTFTRRLTVDSLAGVWGSSGSDVFAVGANGTVLHYDGSRWTAMDSGTAHQLSGVWGSSGSDVFAVGGNGTILHYDGSRWTAMNSGTTLHLSGVAGSSGRDVFAVGDNGAILHYDGSRWTAMDSGTPNRLSAVWCGSDNDVFAVGLFGTARHYDGSSWTDMLPGTTTHLSGVWGSSGHDVFAVGRTVTGPTILHYDGNAWSDAATTNDLYGIWGASGSDVFAVGVRWIGHYDGTTWGGIGPDHFLFGVWGSSGADVFAVGGTGSILHYDGSAWTAMP